MNQTIVKNPGELVGHGDLRVLSLEGVEASGTFLRLGKKLRRVEVSTSVLGRRNNAADFFSIGVEDEEVDEEVDAVDGEIEGGSGLVHGAGVGD